MMSRGQLARITHPDAGGSGVSRLSWWVAKNDVRMSSQTHVIQSYPGRWGLWCQGSSHRVGALFVLATAFSGTAIRASAARAEVVAPSTKGAAGP